MAATALDDTGNESVFTPLLTITVDTASPAVPEFGLAAGARALQFGIAHTTSQHVTLTGITSPNTAVELVQTALSGTSDHAGRYALDDVTLAVGDNVLTAVATDVAGNQSQFTTTITFHDVDGPLVTAGLSHDTGRSDTDGVTSDATISGTVNDASPIAVFEASVSGSPFVDVSSQLPGDQFTLDATTLASIYGANLPDGGHTLSLRAEDALGNSATVMDVMFALDRTAPEAPLPDLLAFSDTGWSSRDNVTQQDLPTIRLVADAGTMVTLFVEGVEVGQEQSMGRVDFPLGPLAEGDYELTAMTEDWAGNASSISAAVTLTIDTTSPAEPVFDLHEQCDTQMLGDRTTTRDTVTLRGETEPNARVTLVEWQLDALADAAGVFHLEYVPLELGINRFTVVARDRAGNESEHTATITREEIYPPEFTVRLLNDTAQGGGTDNDTVSRDPAVVGTITSEREVVRFTAGLNEVDPGNFVDVLGDLESGHFTFDQQRLEEILGEPLEPGSHRLSLQAVNEDGLASEVFDFFFYYDLTAPTSLETNVTFDGLDTFRYEYILSNPAENGTDGDVEVFVDFGVTLPPEAELSNIVTPNGWMTYYDHGEVQITWYTSDADQGIAPGESLVFGFDSKLDAGPAEFIVVMNTAGGPIGALGSTEGPTPRRLHAAKAEAVALDSADAEADTSQAPQDAASTTPAMAASAPEDGSAATRGAYASLSSPRFHADPWRSELNEAPSAPVSWDGELAEGEIPFEEGAAFRYRVAAAGETYGRGPSINKNGYVGFVTQGARQNVYVTPPYGSPAKLMLSIFEAGNWDSDLVQRFAEDVQINDSNQVLAHRYMEASVWVGIYTPWPTGNWYTYPLTYLERWHYDSLIGIPTTEIMGDAGMGPVPVVPPFFGAFVPFYPVAEFYQPLWGGYLPSPYSSTDEFWSILPYASLNNVGKVTFGAILGRNVEGFQQKTAIVSGGFGANNVRSFDAALVDHWPRPLMADTNQFVLRNGESDTSPILVASMDMQDVQRITGPRIVKFGQNPGISDDGKVVVFRGVERLDSGEEIPGIFMSVRNHQTLRFGPAVRIAGIAEDGNLDPGEKWEDDNQNGELDYREDKGYFSAFPDSLADMRVAVNQFTEAEDLAPSLYKVAFLAEDENQVIGLHTMDFRIPDALTPDFKPAGAFVGEQTVANYGQSLSGGVGTVTSISIHDPLGANGDIAFWANTPQGAKIVVATPNLGDVLLTRFGSAPQDDTLSLVELDYEIQLWGGQQELSADTVFEVGFYNSPDGNYAEGQFLGSFEINPNLMGSSYPLRKLNNRDGTTAEFRDAQRLGQHTLQIDPQGTFLQTALEDPLVEVITAVIDYRDRIEPRRDDPRNNDVHFAGFYQEASGKRGVARTGADQDDWVFVEQSNKVTMADSEGNTWEWRNLERPRDIIIVTANGDDGVRPFSSGESFAPEIVTTPLVVNAGLGNDEVYTAAGRDTIFTGVADEANNYNIAFGFGGDDAVIGGAGIDFLLGDGYKGDLTTWKDFIEKLTVDKKLDLGFVEILPVGEGKDTVDGKGGLVNVLIGGGGDDVIKNEGLGGVSIVLGDALEYSSGEEVDLAPLYALRERDPIDLLDPIGTFERLKAAYNAGFTAYQKLSDMNRITHHGRGKDSISTKSVVNLIMAGGGDDKVTGEVGILIAQGNDGNDTIDGEKGEGVLAFGGDGDDTIVGSRYSDAILGGNGDDGISGGAGVLDVLIGDSYELDLPDIFEIINDMFEWKLNFSIGANAAGSGDDTILGEEGLDFIIGGDGNDTIDAGAGVTGMGGVIFGDGLSTGTGITIDVQDIFGMQPPEDSGGGDGDGDGDGDGNGDGDGDGDGDDDGDDGESLDDIGVQIITERTNTPEPQTLAAKLKGIATQILALTDLFKLVGSGADRIAGADGVDLIFGGEGNDEIDTGGGTRGRRVRQRGRRYHRWFQHPLQLPGRWRWIGYADGCQLRRRIPGTDRRPVSRRHV